MKTLYDILFFCLMLLGPWLYAALMKGWSTKSRIVLNTLALSISVPLLVLGIIINNTVLLNIMCGLCILILIKMLGLLYRDYKQENKSKIELEILSQQKNLVEHVKKQEALGKIVDVDDFTEI